MKKLLLILMIYFFPALCSAQQLEELTAQYTSMIRQSNCESAVKTGDEILGLLKQNNKDSSFDFAVVASFQAICYEKLGQPAKAELLYVQSIFLIRKLGKQQEEIYLNVLNSLASIYENTGNYSKGEPLLQEMMNIVKDKAGEANVVYIELIRRMITAQVKTNQQKKAEASWLQLINIQKDISGEQSMVYIEDLMELGFFYESTREYTKAEPGYLRAMNILTQMGDTSSIEYAGVLHILADLYSMMVQYEKAEPIYIIAANLRKKELGEHHPHYANTLNNLGRLYMSTGQNDRAEPLYIQSGTIRKKSLGEAHPDYAISLNNLALLYENMGHYEKAEPLYFEAIEIIKKGWNADGTAMGNLANLYTRMGQFEKAEPLYLASQRIIKQTVGEAHPDYANSLNNLATLYISLVRYKEAESLYLSSHSILKKIVGENHSDYAAGLSNLALLYTMMGQYTQAESLYIKANDIWKKALGESHPDYASGLNSLAFLYAAMGKYTKAAPLYKAAKEIWKRSLGETHPNYAVCLDNLASLYESMGEHSQAASLRIECNRIEIQNLKNTFAILSENEKGKYLAGKAPLIETNHSVLYNFKKTSTGLTHSSFNLQLFIKSLSLADTRNMLEGVSKSNDSSVIKAFTAWRLNKNLLSRQYILPVNKRILRLDSIETRTEELEKELSRKSSVFRNQQRSLGVSPNDVQKNLHENEAAIEFVSFHLYNKKWTDNIFYAAYILKKNDSIPVFVPLCEEKQLQRIFDSAGSTTTGMVNSFYRGIEIKSRNAGSLGIELYNLVWAPLEPYLNGITSLSYSPAGKLNSIAFFALPVDSTTILMDKYTMQQYISTRQVALRDAAVQIKKPAGITLFGDASFSMDSSQLVQNRTENKNISTSLYTPLNRGTKEGAWSNLPGTATEVKTIQRLFDQHNITSKDLTQVAASEENLKALSGNSPQVLHIATHGFFLPPPDKKEKETEFNQGNTYSLADDPLLRNGLVLAGGNYAWSGKTPVEGVEDGIVTAYEISQLNLSETELVVLSACETALGEIKGNEGVFGLQRAFKMAGVKKMIVSLWQVPDKETAELMTTFYSYWLNGKTINDAFAKAQADMRKKYPPFFWGAFVLVE